jgi:hypothetical protein
MTYSVIFFTAAVKSGRDDHTGRGERREPGTGNGEPERQKDGGTGVLFEPDAGAAGYSGLPLV